MRLAGTNFPHGKFNRVNGYKKRLLLQVQQMGWGIRKLKMHVRKCLYGQQHRSCDKKKTWEKRCSLRKDNLDAAKSKCTTYFKVCFKYYREVTNVEIFMFKLLLCLNSYSSRYRTKENKLVPRIWRMGIAIWWNKMWSQVMESVSTIHRSTENFERKVRKVA